MQFDNDFDQLDELEELEDILPIKNISRKQRQTENRTKQKQKAGSSKAKSVKMLAAEENKINFTYKASRHEADWIKDSLGKFYQQQWFDDVLRVVKGGKEASVYLCLASETVDAEYIAAKVYRPRKFRNLRKDHLYREGRERLDSDGNAITNDGKLYAIRKKSRYGLELMHTSWIEHEFKTLEILHAAGADVPKPYARGNNAILMGYLGDVNNPAPTLNEVDLDPSEARILFERSLHNIEIMLSKGRVHGDLSAYNILYWEGEITLIDFPQAISPTKNNNAYRIFKRDVTRICDYFAQQGVRTDPVKIASGMWKAHNHPTEPRIDPLYLDAEDESDRRRWEKASRQD